MIMPSLEPAQPYKLDLAANEVASAIRHARGEAIRMAAPDGVDIEPSAGRIRVFRGAPGTTPPTPTYDVVHPISRGL